MSWGNVVLGGWFTLLSLGTLVVVARTYRSHALSRAEIAGWPRVPGRVTTMAQEPWRLPGTSRAKVVAVAHYHYLDPADEQTRTGKDAYQQRAAEPGTKVLVALDPHRPGRSRLDVFTDRQAKGVGCGLAIVTAAAAAFLVVGLGLLVTGLR